MLLKYPGRIGEAAIFGAGCWAQQNSDSSAVQGMACSISGAGEYITRSTLARAIGEALEISDEDANAHNILHQILLNRFWTQFQERDANPNAGILLLTKEQTDSGQSIPRLWCAFTTESMAIAYMSSKDAKAKSTILRRSHESQSGRGPPIFITSLSLGKD